MRSVLTVIGAVLVLVVLSTPASAQYSYLRISATPMQTFALTSNPTAGQTLTILSEWGWLSGDSNISVCAAMTTPMRGTGTNTDTISQTNVQVNGVSIVSGGTNCGIAGATLVGSGTMSWLMPGTRTDTPTIRIAGYPSTLSPDTYTGTITLYAFTY